LSFAGSPSGRVKQFTGSGPERASGKERSGVRLTIWIWGPMRSCSELSIRAWRERRVKKIEIVVKHISSNGCGEPASECARRPESHQVAFVDVRVGADLSDQLGGQIQHAKWLNHLDVSPVTTISGGSCDNDERSTLWILYERLQSRDSE
jgi:hypothetical protein